ncbi:MULTISPECIES: GNAT family N-acetyltransferase [unclassified Tenacibaculum]|uniref:GNAT family N-acetyltransferase n=1 Tax=unclassified Tenacibaculum TaxID=2635139 RepID=UPI001F25464B|nr:GNAT family N-acetyltransferase [Tenacibaculum sp. Cn5-34]MCF2874381.1 GNAT family N-acetyltransferase [Tenacibaculum sp. Cn5-1]MCF2934962.1 GNAT family N-acetyltransferase [Tenacibaculum sp. Cn5-34]MCG7511172.1 GNAT family N-acetyltransferase [Tenacibaculum sp. Cn5-46]
MENQVKKENYQYYLLQYKNDNVGYLGIQKLDKKLILSKLYILKAFRGLKIGKSALNYVHQYAKENHIENIELIVNQQNQNTVEIYQKNGFKIIDSITNSFPNGHSVNDYKMEKKLV